MEFKEQLSEYGKIINRNLSSYMEIPSKENRKLIEAMKYSLFAGGKRLRPILVLATYDMFDSRANNRRSENYSFVMPYACAIEMVHTYSLIHDDLPAMDDDDLRRGKPTNHRVYGEALAILAGDGLLNYAFEIMLESALNQNNTKTHVDVIKEIATASGIYGMIGGQAVDIESENKDIDLSTISYIHHNKTAALISVSMKVGAVLAGASYKDVKIIGKLGRDLGLAFQIRDDILDIVGDESKTGKNVGSDNSCNKSTYPKIIGLEKSNEKVISLTNNISSVLDEYNSTFLRELCTYLMTRES
ncbi:MAG: farnesyl-diphosphate synthase [Alkaliphilus sp.]|jgi:geranylgeranyl diphosphate synthase type II|nr:polyprenyl synthetase family protein [Alkaliphilus sp. AH-315-G20]PHS36520.1 MAG: farnesyl-diphosphate synthase [Alkaliphilus sp.]